MRVAILTILSGNYGNRLQNYALQEVLRCEGHEVRTLRRSRSLPAEPLGHAVRSLVKRDARTRFLAFDRARIRLSGRVAAQDYVSPGLADCYDAFVIGSDQVWNPTFDFYGDVAYLPQVPSAQKVAYAASFGVSSIERNREEIAVLLNGVPHISMREDAGASIVEELTGRTVPTVVDPTMLLSADEWGLIERRPRFSAVDRPFCLKHVLGDDVDDGRIRDMARERGLSVVDLRDQSLPVGPAEFLWLVHNAALVATDSFHGSVFSALFHRPFVIFERVDGQRSMASRLDTLCRTFGLEHHRVASSDFDPGRCEREHWRGFEDVLGREGLRSRTWLREALAQVQASGA